MKKKKVDVDKEIKIIIDSLGRLDPKKQLQSFKRMKDSIERVDTLENQIGVWDAVLQQFVFFNEDTDLIGERVKMISKSLLERTKKEKIPKNLQKTIKTDRWVFDW